METNELAVEILKDKFGLEHLSNLEVEFLITEVHRLTKKPRRQYGRVSEDIKESIERDYLEGMPTSVIHARYPALGKSTISYIITRTREKHGITERNR